jgi:immunity protein, SdpI family
MNVRPMLTYSAVVVGLMLALSAWAWTQLPADASIPIHWGIDGQANGYAPKLVGLLLLPAITIGIAALFAVIPRVEPRRANLERSSTAYRATWIGVVTLMGVIQAAIVAAALGATFEVNRVVLVGVGALFIVIGNYLPKVRSNYLMGIRTPWTLTSDLSWQKTHRLGGRLFVLEGLAFLVLGLVGASPQWMVVAIVGAVVILVVVLFAYSYQVWKADPEKRPS